jgi:hypothetical protein
MPRREGDVFRLGTAMSVSSRGVSLRHRSAAQIAANGKQAGMPIKAGLIEEGSA